MSTEQVKYLSDEALKAKNKLLFSSLALIIILVFEPTLTGFLGNFSIKVAEYPILFGILIALVIFWLNIRFILVVNSEHPNSMGLNLVNSIEDISKSFSQLSESDYLSIKNSQDNAFLEQKSKLKSLRVIVIMDILVPLFIGTLSLIIFAITSFKGDFVEKIYLNKTKQISDYKVESASLEIKDITIKKIEK